jgi:hypothetical protein
MFQDKPEKPQFHVHHALLPAKIAVALPQQIVFHALAPIFIMKISTSVTQLVNQDSVSQQKAIFVKHVGRLALPVLQSCH